MKTQTFHLKIEKPCHENWETMTVAQQGKFCASCTKVVIDFSKMSCEQIAGYFKTHTGKTCGNFRKTQLDQSYSFIYKAPFSFNTTFVRFSLAGVLIFSGLKGYSQNNFQKDNCGNTKVTLMDNMVKGHVKRSVNDQSAPAKNNLLNIKLKDNSTGRHLGVGVITINETQQRLKLNKNGIYACKLPDSLANKVIHLTITATGYSNEIVEVNMDEQGAKILNVGMDNYSDMKRGEVMYVPQEPNVKN